MYIDFGIIIIKMEPKNKRRKVSKKQTIFENVDDERQCLQIIWAIDEVLNNGNNNNNNNNTIPYPLLKEIGEYSTGNLVKCKGELEHEECKGWIHFLKGDNFNINCNNVSYAWNLFKYECDDNQCGKVSHVMLCSDDNCDRIIQIKEDESPYPSSVCENALRLKPLCQQIYCIEHSQQNGITCGACSNFYCFSCEKECGSHCATCDEYWCQDHVEESTFFIGKDYYCDKCMSSGYCEQNPYAILLE